jgi:hypothetical protein
LRLQGTKAVFCYTIARDVEIASTFWGNKLHQLSYSPRFHKIKIQKKFPLKISTKKQIKKNFQKKISKKNIKKKFQKKNSKKKKKPKILCKYAFENLGGLRPLVWEE